MNRVYHSNPAASDEYHQATLKLKPLVNMTFQCGQCGARCSLAGRTKLKLPNSARVAWKCRACSV